MGVFIEAGRKEILVLKSIGILKTVRPQPKLLAQQIKIHQK
jgi:hypothetical protein